MDESCKEALYEEIVSYPEIANYNIPQMWHWVWDSSFCQWTRAHRSCDNTFKITWVVSLSVIAWVALYSLHHLGCVYFVATWVWRSNCGMEDQDSVGKWDEGLDTGGQIRKNWCQIGSICMRFEKIENVILALSSQLSSQASRKRRRAWALGRMTLSLSAKSELRWWIENTEFACDVIHHTQP